MAKKTEQDLLSLLKNNKQRRDSNELDINVDLSEEERDKTTVSVFDRANNLVAELKNFDFASCVKESREQNKKAINPSTFKAWFEDEKLPQDDEIVSITFRASDDKDDYERLILDLEILPKRLLYLNLLTQKIGTRLNLELYDYEGNLVDETQLHITAYGSASLMTPICLNHHSLLSTSYFNNPAYIFRCKATIIR